MRELPDKNDSWHEPCKGESLFLIFLREPLRIVGGQITVPDSPGLGVQADMAQIEKAHQLYQQIQLAERDDAATMQFLIPGWKFDPKRPCLVR